MERGLEGVKEMRKGLREKGHVEPTMNGKGEKERWGEGVRRGRERKEKSWECDRQEVR